MKFATLGVPKKLRCFYGNVYWKCGCRVHLLGYRKWKIFVRELQLAHLSIMAILFFGPLK